MTPRLVSAYFPSTDVSVDRGEQYVRLAQVLAYTARTHLPTWDRRITEIVPPTDRSALANASHVWNTAKLEAWADAVAEAPDGTPVLLMDADMMILRPLDDLWAWPFDLAYTLRSRSSLPFNGGVVALRITDQTRAFMARWVALNRQFLTDAAAHQPWRAKYAGINQASFGALLEAADHGCDLLTLPCAEWNCVEWELFDPEITRVVHVKSKLRRELFGWAAPVSPVHKRLISQWKALEQEATAAVCA